MSLYPLRCIQSSLNSIAHLTMLTHFVKLKNPKPIIFDKKQKFPNISNTVCQSYINPLRYKLQTYKT